MKKLPLIVVLTTLALGLAFAKNSQNILPLGSPAYSLMDALYLATGNGTPSDSRPWSVAETRLILSRVERSSLTGPLAKAWDEIAAILEEAELYESDGAQFDLDAIFALEAYAHSNDEEFVEESDWIYGYEERKPVLKLALEMGFADNFYTYCDLEYARGRFSAKDTILTLTEDNDYNIGTAMPGYDKARSQVSIYSYHYAKKFNTNLLDMVDVNFECPRRAFISLGDDWWNLQMGRDKVSWGNGHSGNLVIGDQLDHHDYLRFVAFSKTMKYEATDLFLTHPNFVDQDESSSPGIKMFLAHRLEFKPWNWLSFAISEDAMYQDEAIDLHYLSPAFIYHNLNTRTNFNAIAHAELNICPLPGLSLYGQFVLDQARAPLEGNSQPGAWGILGGVEWAMPLGSGILASSLEAAATTCYLYRRDIIDFLVLERYFTIDAGGGYILHGDYLGYRYGGDAVVLQADLSYTWPGRGSLALKATGSRHGQVGLNGIPDAYSGSGVYSPSDSSFLSGSTIAEALVLGLKADYRLSLTPRWMETKLWTELDWIGRRDYVKATDTLASYYKNACQDLQFTAGISVAF